LNNHQTFLMRRSILNLKNESCEHFQLRARVTTSGSQIHGVSVSHGDAFSRVVRSVAEQLLAKRHVVEWRQITPQPLCTSAARPRLWPYLPYLSSDRVLMKIEMKGCCDGVMTMREGEIQVTVAHHVLPHTSHDPRQRLPAHVNSCHFLLRSPVSWSATVTEVIHCTNLPHQYHS
jgi:hypothetical protein